MSQPLPPNFYTRPTLQIARDLLGRHLVRVDNDKVIRTRIVEVEAYHQDGDAAAHSYNGPTARNRVMFGKPGTLYVYFIYGMHYCMNVVTEAEGVGAAVLIRALEPLAGEDLIRTHRGARVRRVDLTNGPGKCCQALALDRSHDGISLQGPLLWLEEGSPVLDADIRTGPRIGISKSVALPWRFFVADCVWVSKMPGRSKTAS